MAKLNFSKLNDIEPYNFNSSYFVDPTQIAENTLSIANTTTDNWFLFIILVLIYLFLFVVINDKEGQFSLDFLASNIFASGVCFAISGLGLVLGFTNTYSDVRFFGTLFFIFVVGKYLNRTKTP